MLKVILEKDKENKWEPRMVMKVIHNGKVICEEYDGGEPEDSSFARDWNFVPFMIEKAYDLGRQDYKEEMQEEMKSELKRIIDTDGYQEMADGFGQAKDIMKDKK